MGRTLVWAAALWPLLAGVVHAQPFAFRVRAELEARTNEGTGALPLVSERLRTEIDGQNATSSLRQVFHNRTSATLEGQYTLRVDRGSRVTGFAYYVGEERIVGEVVARQAANEVYTQVTTARRDPAVLEETADGEASFRVFPIRPGEDKAVEVTYTEWLTRRAQVVTYRAPLGSPNADVEVTLLDPRAREVRSPTHRIEATPIPGGVRIRTRGAISFHGELVLRYRIEERPWALSAYVHRDANQAGYFVLSLAAPTGLAGSASPKDVTLVLDRSGSMSGDAIDNARRAAADVIRRLGAHDRLNVLAFDDDVEPLFRNPQPIDQARAAALSFVGNLSVGGGTDIAFALRRALEGQNDDAGGRPRIVILVTDGQSEPGPALALAASDTHDVRVFTVGVGEGVNRPLLSRLAADKRGTFTFIGQASELESEVGHLYAQIAEPLLVDLSLDVEGGVASRTYPRTLPDLFVDDEVTIRGRIRAEGPFRFIVRGRVADRPVELSARAEMPALVRRPWVGRRWAMARVADVLEEIELHGEQPELRDEVLSLALAYDFVTPYTAYLAIPERELTAEARVTLDNARAQRVAAQAQNADAVAVVAGSQPLMARTRMATEQSGGGEADLAATQPSAPQATDSSHAGCASCSVGRRKDPPWMGTAVLAGTLAISIFRRQRRS
jgi:Ca-activated chloride channel family protein